MVKMEVGAQKMGKRSALALISSTSASKFRLPPTLVFIRLNLKSLGEVQTELF